MSRKHIVATPLIMIASWALSPMISGNTNVAPNIATTCWAPRPTVLGHDSRSSGATTSFAPRVPSCSFQPIDTAPPQVTPWWVTEVTPGSFDEPTCGQCLPGHGGIDTTHLHHKKRQRRGQLQVRRSELILPGPEGPGFAVGSRAHQLMLHGQVSK